MGKARFLFEGRAALLHREVGAGVGQGQVPAPSAHAFVLQRHDAGPETGALLIQTLYLSCAPDCCALLRDAPSGSSANYRLLRTSLRTGHSRHPWESLSDQ